MQIIEQIQASVNNLVSMLPAELIVPMQVLIIFTATLIILNLVRFVIERKVASVIKKSPYTADDLALRIIRGFDSKFFFVVSLYFSVSLTQTPEWLKTFTQGLTLIAVAIYIVGAVQKVVAYGVERYISSKGDGAAYEKSVSRFVSWLSSLLLWSIAGLFILQNVGIDVSTLIGGLGIAGLAIGFAIQNLLEDIFSFFSIYFDKPFKEGDFIVLGEDKGTVRQVGVKSTRIKSLNGEEVVIPNKEMTSTRLNNFAKLEKRTKVFSFGIEYETPLEKVKKVQEIVTGIFNDLENSELGRVTFKHFGDSALLFEVLYHIEDSSYEIYINERHDMNLMLLERLSNEGISMAYPTQTVHIKNS